MKPVDLNEIQNKIQNLHVYSDFSPKPLADLMLAMTQDMR